MTLGIILAFLAAYFPFVAQHNIALLWLLALLAFLFAGYRVWRKEHQALLNAETELGQPRLTGFFQEVSASYFYDETKIPELGFFEPYTTILGTDIVLYVRIMNMSPTPTTLHNFSLVIKSEGEQWVAEHAEEPKPHDHTTWTPPDVIEKEKRMTNLVTYLNNPEKVVTRGRGIDGYLAFRVPGFGAQDLTLPSTQSEKSIEINMALFVQDWEGKPHPIEDMWGPKQRPSQRLSSCEN